MPYKANLGSEDGYLYGGEVEDIALENGLKFCVDWQKGQKTGFFVDQRENRSLLERYAKGHSVLNMFCYTGGFSFYAMRGGAKVVHSVDSSAKAISLTNRNVELNFPGDPRHEDVYKRQLFRYRTLSDRQYRRTHLIFQAGHDRCRFLGRTHPYRLHTAPDTGTCRSGEPVSYTHLAIREIGNSISLPEVAIKSANSSTIATI